MNETGQPGADDRFTEALGVLVGPADAEDVRAAVEGHTGSWILRLANEEGDVVWQKQGYAWSVVDGEDGFAFVVAATEQGAGNPGCTRTHPWSSLSSTNWLSRARLSSTQAAAGLLDAYLAAETV
jgi:hypothetical protein